MHLYFLAKFTKCFRQVKQVKVLKNYYGDLCGPLTDTYKLIVYNYTLSKELGELGQKIEMHLHLLAKLTKCFR